MRIYFLNSKDPISFTGDAGKIIRKILAKKFDRDAVEHLLGKHRLPEGWEEIKPVLKNLLEQESLGRLETLVRTGSEPEGWQEILGRNLKARRKALRLRQRALAAKLGCTLTWLSGTERGMTNPLVNDLKKLADALAVSPVELLGGPRSDYRDTDLARGLAIKVRVLHAQTGGRKTDSQSLATASGAGHLRLSTVAQIAKEFKLQLYDLFREEETGRHVCGVRSYRDFFGWAEQAPDSLEVCVELINPETIPEGWTVAEQSPEDSASRNTRWENSAGSVTVCYYEERDSGGRLEYSRARVVVRGTGNCSGDAVVSAINSAHGD